MNEIISLLAGRQRFVLSTHVNPDGDGIGCEIAMAAWLDLQGKQVAVINHSPTPAVYSFLDPESRIQVFTPPRDARTIAEAEVILLLDMNQPGRLQSMERAVLDSPALRVCIDHHLDPDPFAQYQLIDNDATSTGEILYRLFTHQGQSNLTPRIATALYCAIMTDTGSFRYPRVDPETHRIVAHLLECGADPVAVYSSVYEQWSSGRIHLLGEMLAGLETLAGGRIAYVTITQEMLRRTGTTEEDTDNFTTYPMSVGGVVVGILFLELTDGMKISFRSKGEIPINDLAKEFGGGGHKNAAGARVDGGRLLDMRAHVLRSALHYLPHSEQHRAIHD